MAEPKLNYRQQAFANEYIVDLNATQAAIRAGYSADTAYSIGSENLSKPDIAEAIQKAMDLRSERTAITADRVLAEIARMGFADVRQIFNEAGQLMPVHLLSDEVAAAVQQIEVVTKFGAKDADGNQDIEYVHKIKLADKKGSLEMLAKHLVLLSDKIELTGKDGGPIETQDIGTKELARKLAFLLNKGVSDGNA